MKIVIEKIMFFLNTILVKSVNIFVCNLCFCIFRCQIMTQIMDRFFRVKLLNHLAVEILIHLDDKTLTNCRSVCKAWKVLIDNQKFYYVRQLNKILQAESFKNVQMWEFFDIRPDWLIILSSFDTSKKLIELKNMTKIHEFVYAL